MRILIYITFLSLALACEKRTDFYLDKNEIPSSSVTSLNIWSKSENKQKNTSIYDTVKAGFDYVFKHELTDDNSMFTTFFNTNTNGLINHIVGSNLTLVNDSIKITNKLNNYSFNTNVIGNSSINIKSKDLFNKETVNDIYLYVFYNKLPISDLTLTVVPMTNGRTFLFNGSGSYDKDAIYGGQILEYQFEVKLNNNIISTSIVTTPTLNFTFANTGTYDVSLSVKDNNNVWSAKSIKSVTII